MLLIDVQEGFPVVILLAIVDVFICESDLAFVVLAWMLSSGLTGYTVVLISFKNCIDGVIYNVKDSN